MKDSVIPYFDSLCKKIEYNYASALNHGDEESFHDLRVTVKRMRALYSFVKFVDPDFNERRHFRQFRSLFKAAAAVRDVHVQLNVLEGFKKKLKQDVSEYENYLKNLEHEELEAFTEFGREFAVEELRKRRRNLKTSLRKTTLYEGLAFAQKRYEELAAQLKKIKEERKNPEDELHTIRKVSKELRYTLEITEVCLPELNPRPALMAELKEMHRYLGAWHDDEIALQYLTRFLSLPNGGVLDGETYAALTALIGEEKQDLVHEFEQSWNSFVQGISGEQQLQQQ